MARKNKKKGIQPQFSRGVQIPLPLLKARQLRSNLLARVKTQELKDTTPTIKKLEQFFNHEHFICYYCIKELPIELTTCDHKTPLKRGGTNELENLCICCSDCNSVKGELSEINFRDLIELIKNWGEEGEYLLTRLRRGSTIFKR